MIDRVAEMYRCDWDKVFEMNVILFLNVYNYSLSKQKLQEHMMKEHAKEMKAKYGKHH